MENLYYIDGGCSNNGSQDAKGVAVATDSNGNPLFDEKLTTKIGFKKLKPSIITNNVAEFEALRRLVYRPSVQMQRNIKVLSDSDILVKCFSGLWRCKQGHLAVILLDTILEVQRAGMTVQIDWIPRDENKAGIYIESQYNL